MTEPVYKEINGVTVKQEDGAEWIACLRQNEEKMKIITNYHRREFDYGIPEWSTEEEPCFTYHRQRYFLSEFQRTEEGSDLHRAGYNGYIAETYFNGVAVKITDDGVFTVARFAYL